MKIKLSQAEIFEIEQILKPDGKREEARELLYEIAIAKGAPCLGQDQYYGLREDGFIVGPNGELIEETKAQE